ncbi:MAG TPA: response regulator [Terriglobia bacterium]|nr:response regulator [Terriglobia bacterium]
MSNNLRPILLVEDDPNDVELVQKAFDDGHLANPVIVARDGVEALSLLRPDGNTGQCAMLPVVVLMDIKMPRMNGLELLKEIRTDPRLKHIPAVIMTSSRASPDLDEAYKLGVNAYVVKPVNFSDFVEAIKVIGKFWAVLNELPDELTLPE